ncbi:MAG: hypothetical protein IPF38_12990 [Burkholderiales bacterium]|nr:hypothetical protein [Burkholderiales bacterium]
MRGKTECGRAQRHAANGHAAAIQVDGVGLLVASLAITTVPVRAHPPGWA